MAFNYLSQQLSQYNNAANQISYIFPTVQNLIADNYISKIMDVQEVTDVNGQLLALDFYHMLTDSSGNTIGVRFRYYENELPLLASSLKQYSQLQTWQDTIGLQEHITVSAKASGNYLKISARSAPTVTAASTNSINATAQQSHTSKKVGLGSRLSRRSSSVKNEHTSKFFEDDNTWNDEEDWLDDDEE